MQLGKVLKNRGHFPSDEAATKLIYLVLRDITKSGQNRPLPGSCPLANLRSNSGKDFLQSPQTKNHEKVACIMNIN
jgi:hypothetical protein